MKDGDHQRNLSARLAMFVRQAAKVTV